jgi:hypothetical protein
MRAISGAVVVLSGTVLVAAAMTPGTPPEQARMAVGIFGAVLVLIGLIAWLVGFLGDKGHT